MKSKSIQYWLDADVNKKISNVSNELENTDLQV